MAPPTTTGTCRFCGSEFAKVGMGRHLKACKQRAEFAGQGKSGRLLHLQVDGTYDPEYWMHLEVPAVVTLAELDTFLRWTWLECCGHLSAF